MRKKISDSQKAAIALEAIRGDKTVNEIATKFGVHPNLVGQYKKFALENMAAIFNRKEDGRIKELTQERDELHRQIGEQKVDNDWLKKKCKQFGLV